MIYDENILLKKFEITGLFEKKDVALDFNNFNNVEIFIGQNGIGKTTILNIIYYTLSLNLLELRKMPFSTIKVTLSNGENANISREDLFSFVPINGKFSPGALRDIEEYLGADYVHKLNETIEHSDSVEMANILEHISNKPAIPQRLKRYLKRMIPENEISANMNQLKKLIYKLKIEKKDIFYFPTYRRIEEDIKKFTKKEISLGSISGDIIQFGMTDVEQKFREIENVISKAINDTFSNLTSDMISYLSMNQSISDERKRKIENISTVEIILSRLAHKISDEVKNNVIHLFANQSNIYKKEFEPLVYFLCGLIDKYEENMHMEEHLNTFTKVVNKYLVNKEIIYDPHNIQIYIIESDSDNKDPLPLSALSSGEKQIVSLYSKIYLSFTDSFIVLFDEPELSLSIEWQETLIADIMRSKKCKFLIAVTHSPFIFDNKFEESARSMELFISSKANFKDKDEDYSV